MSEEPKNELVKVDLRLFEVGDWNIACGESQAAERNFMPKVIEDVARFDPEEIWRQMTNANGVTPDMPIDLVSFRFGMYALGLILAASKRKRKLKRAGFVV